MVVLKNMLLKQDLLGLILYRGYKEASSRHDVPKL